MKKYFALLLCPWAVQALPINYDSAVRTRVLNDLKQTIVIKYSLLEIKKKRIGFDGAKRLDSCIEREGKIPASTLLEFEDRALECIAAFRDTHIVTMAQTPRPSVLTGVSLRLVNSQVVVAGIDKKVIEITQGLLRLAGRTEILEEILKPGAVVESLDGENPLKRISTMARFINGSSPAFVAGQAALALTNRDFSYPTNQDLIIKIAGYEPVPLRWYVFPIALREDLRHLLLEQLQLKLLVAFGFDRSRPVDGYGAGYSGFDERNALAPDTQVLWNERKSEALRMGRMSYAGGQACYLQILDSRSNRLAQRGSPIPLNRSSEMAKFIKQCKTDNLKMVVDLRVNGGGDNQIPLDDFAMLIPSGQKFGTTVTSGRLSLHLRQLFEVFYLGPQFPFRDWSEYSQDRYYRAVAAADAAGAEYIDGVPARDAEATADAGGYELPMVVVTSPLCVSGCEMMARMLRNRPNTTFVGTQTNGTGGMVFQNPLFPMAAGWRDDITGTIQVRMPNTLFGVLSGPAGGGELIPFTQIENLMFENRPLQPDVRHATAIEDIVNDNAALKLTIERALLN